MHTFTFAGNGSYGNRGCEAILRGTVRAMETAFSDCVYINSYFPDRKPDLKEGGWDKNIQYLPFESNPQKNLLSYDWWNFRLQSKLKPEKGKYFRFGNFPKVIRHSSAVLMVGGDNYSLDYGKPDTFFYLNKLTLEQNRPVVLWGASVGPFSKDPEYEKWAAVQLKKVHRIYAREAITVNYLESIGITENVVRVADPAFLMEPEEVDYSQEILAMSAKGAIGINISPLLGRYITGIDDQDWVLQAKEIIIQISHTFRLPIILIPHVTFQTQNHKSDDHVFLKKVLDILPNEIRKNVTLLDRCYNAAQTKYLISKLKIFIGARTHSTIAALSSIIPTLVLGYSIKGRGIVQDLFDDDQWLIESEKISSKLICEKVDHLLLNQDAVKEHLSSKIQGIKNLAKQAAYNLKDLLNE